MLGPELNILQRKMSFILATLTMRGPVAGKWRSQDETSAQSNCKARHTGTMSYCVSHTSPRSPVLNSVSGPKMYSKIPEARERERAVPHPWKVICIYWMATFPCLSKCLCMRSWVNIDVGMPTLLPNKMRRGSKEEMETSTLYGRIPPSMRVSTAHLGLWELCWMTGT